MLKQQVVNTDTLAQDVKQLRGEYLNYAAAIVQTLKFAQDTTQRGGPDAPDTTKKAS